MSDPKVEKQKPVPPFVQFCCAAVPMVFDDSLSYYEALCAMWKYLDETRQVVNNNATVTEEQIALYNELHDYVEHYFDNLDVQEEINNKLDQMADSGELGVLMGRYIQPYLTEYEGQVNDKLAEQDADINAIETRVDALASGSPLVASSTDDMTDTTRVYVNTSDGNWYYYDGDSWEVGGVYQASQLALFSVIGGMIKAGNVTKDKLKNVISILSKATSIIRGKAITNFNTTNGITTSDDVNSNVAIFNYSDVKDLAVHFKIDSFTTSGGSNKRIVGYDADDLTKHTSQAYSGFDASIWYDSVTGYGVIPMKWSDSVNEYIDTVAVTLNADCDIFYLPPYTKSPMIAGDSIKIKSSDMRNFGNEIRGTYCVGYLSDKTPNESRNWRMNKLLISLSSTNLSRISGAYLKIGNPDSTFTTRIMFYKQGVRQYRFSLSTILSSDAYDVTTGYINIGQLASTVLSNDYDYVALYYESDIEDVPVYTTYLTSDNPNYDLFSASDDYDLLVPPKVKAVENQTMCFYFQNAIRYQNTDNIAYKAISNAFMNNDRLSILATDTVGTSTPYLMVKSSYKSSGKFERFNYQVVQANAGNGQTKKVLMIGDSMTQGDSTLRLQNLFADDVMNIELLGTKHKYNDDNKYEGRAGWSTVDYVTDSHKNGFTNPFYNPEVGVETFDFSYYMTNQNYSDVDYVFLNLGTNDNNTSDADLVANLNLMVTSIHTFDPDIKIGIWLPPNRGITKNVQVSSLEYTFSFMRVNKLYIDTYGNSNDVFLIPVNLNINPYEDYDVENISISDLDEYSVEYSNINRSIHPATDGYYKIGDVFYAWIKYFASL